MTLEDIREKGKGKVAVDGAEVCAIIPIQIRQSFVRRFLTSLENG